jgi:putative nucleotidyltransferase with HDIG domain
MEIVLISDGPLPLDSPVRKLPFFFPSRLVKMTDVSSRTVGAAKVAVIELIDASDAGLTALTGAWESIAKIPVICLIEQKNRREVMQASALGNTDILERDTPLSFLIRRIKSAVAIDPAVGVPATVPAETLEAFVKGTALLESLAFSATEGSKIQVNLLNESAGEILSALTLYGMSPWLDAIRSHHSATYCHSLMVAGMAGLFARHLGWSETDCRQVVAGGLVHDIGKMLIPLTILDKPDHLTDEERTLIEKHPQFSRDILKPRLEIPYDIKKMAIQHHEYLDGTGYPDGLAANKLTPKVRLMTICDIFSALTETRAYRESLPTRVAVDILKKMGPKLDQDMLQKFCGMVLDRSFGDVSRDRVTTEV